MDFTVMKWCSLCCRSLPEDSSKRRRVTQHLVKSGPSLTDIKTSFPRRTASFSGLSRSTVYPISFAAFTIDNKLCHHSFSLHSVPVLPHQCILCQPRLRVLAVHNLKVTWHLAPHWLYANFSREHENHARVARPFLRVLVMQCIQRCRKGRRLGSRRLTQ